MHVQSGRVLRHALPLTCRQALGKDTCFLMLPREQLSNFAGQLAVVDPLLPADFPGSLTADESVEQQQEGGGS